MNWTRTWKPKVSSLNSVLSSFYYYFSILFVQILLVQDSCKIGNIFIKDLKKKLPKIEANFTNFEVWSSKTELPKI